MTDRSGQLFSYGLHRLCLGAAGLAALLLAAGCTTGSGTGAGGSAPQSSAALIGPKDTGTFPNLNIVPQSAAPQFTDDQKNAKLAQLAADRTRAKAAASGAGGKADPAELARLGRTHGSDTLKQIEGKCDPTLDPTCK